MIINLNIYIVKEIEKLLDYNLFFLIKLTNKNNYFTYSNIFSNINSFILEPNLKKWYINYTKMPCNKLNLNYGIKKNYINVIKYYQSEWDENTLKKVITNRCDIDVIKYLVENKCILNKWALVKAVIDNNFVLIKYLEKNNIPLSCWATAFACSKKNRFILEWLINKGCDYNYITFNFACSAGDLDNLKYLYNINCEHKPQCYGWAIKNNHLHVIEWLFSLNIPLVEFKLHRYIRKNNIESIRWGMNNMIYDKKKCMLMAIKTNNISLINYLYQLDSN